VRAYIIDDPMRRLRRMTLANNGYHAFVGLAPPRLGDDPGWIDSGSILDRISQDYKDRSLASESVKIAQGFKGDIPPKQIMQTPFNTFRTSEITCLAWPHVLPGHMFCLATCLAQLYALPSHMP
jgi:hypothetical protein